MLLLVFFLSYVDDSHDKVWKLALLKQLLSKVNSKSANLNCMECLFSVRHLDMTRGVLRYWRAHSCVSRACTCIFFFNQLSCSCMFMLMIEFGNIMCVVISEEWTNGSFLQQGGSTWSHPLTAGPRRTCWPLFFNVTWIPGHCFSNTAALLSPTPHCYFLKKGQFDYCECIVPVCNLKYLRTDFWAILCNRDDICSYRTKFTQSNREWWKLYKY